MHVPLHACKRRAGLRDGPPGRRVRVGERGCIGDLAAGKASAGLEVLAP